jgi:hypothetical protein
MNYANQYVSLQNVGPLGGLDEKKDLHISLRSVSWSVVNRIPFLPAQSAGGRFYPVTLEQLAGGADPDQWWI